MVRIRTPQKFPMGTRVANPLEGRTGRVDKFDVDTGLYTLLFHDGHREQVDEVGAAHFVVKTQASENSSSSSNCHTDANNADEADDPQQLLGTAVSKTLRSYDNQERVVFGHVLTFFPDVSKYRVSFSDDSFEEWTRVEVNANVEITRVAAEKKKAAASDGMSSSSGKKRSAEGGDKHHTKKKKKHKHSSYEESDDEDEPAILVEPQEEEEPMQLNQMKYPSRAAAYMIIRRVLCVILAQDTIKKLRTEKQVAVLNNEDIKPKRALESFVEAGGLSCLNKVLVSWMRKPTTHSGALLILKVLAALPGVTPDAMLQSNIGKTLRGIGNACQTMDHVDQVLGDLAEWIICSWKRNVARKPFNMSTRDLIKENSSALRAVDTLPLYVPPPPTAEKNMTEKQVMTNHMRKLLSGDNDAQIAAKAAAAAAKKDEEDVNFLPRFNSLGSEDARRPARQTILLDTLAARINREHVEGLKKYQQAMEAKRAEEEKQAKASGDANSSDAGAASTSASATASNDETKKSIWDQDGRDQVSIGRLLFGRPQILMFNRNVCVVNMMSTGRSRALARQSVAGGDDAVALDEEVSPAELPPANKVHAPKKSILKSLKEVKAVTDVDWEQYVVTVD